MLTNPLLVTGAVSVAVGLAIMGATGRVERRRGWPPSGPSLRSRRLWDVFGQTLALFGAGCLVVGAFLQ